MKRRYRQIARVVWRYCRQGMGRFKGIGWQKYDAEYVTDADRIKELLSK